MVDGVSVPVGVLEEGDKGAEIGLVGVLRADPLRSSFMGLKGS